MIYLDHAATTRPCPEALAAMADAQERCWGNPSAIYGPGRQAKALLESARRTVAGALNASPGEILFTSGGTESDVQALFTAARWGAAQGRRHLVSTRIEHHAVLRTLSALQERGFSVTLLGVDEKGRVDPADAAAALTPDTCLLSVMTANNEVGTIQPVAELGALCRQRKVLFHTDAVQAAGHLPLDVQAQNIDLLSLSAHKFHGPRGAGALYVRRGVEAANVLFGGGQERGHRPGTENLPAIAGMAAALRRAVETMPRDAARTGALRDRLATALLAIPGAALNGDPERRLPGHLNVSFAGLSAETLLLLLDERGICASAGAACSAGALEPSHVLLAMGQPPARARSALRLTLDASNTEEEVDTAAAVIAGLVETLRKNHF